jgi:hypothetical protein
MTAPKYGGVAARVTRDGGYNMVDLLRQVCLELDDQHGARKAYARALEIIERLQRQNLYVEATAVTATAAIGTGYEGRVLEPLARAVVFNLPREPGASERGLRQCQRTRSWG